MGGAQLVPLKTLRSVGNDYQNKINLAGSPINEKIIDDHLAVQAIIRSYQVKYVSYTVHCLSLLLFAHFASHYTNPADVLLFVFPWFRILL